MAILKGLKVLAKYPAFTSEEIKSLVVESKWMDELQARVMSEVERLSRRLAGRVKELAERYEVPLPQIANRVIDMEAKVNSHLKKMGFKI